MTLELTDLEALKDAAIASFEERMAHSAQNEIAERVVAQLQANLEQIYRVVVLLQKNEPTMEGVAIIWAKMVSVCDEFARRLSDRVDRSPAFRAFYDRVLDLRNAAEERRQLHSLP